MNWEEKFKIVDSCLETNSEIDSDFYINPNRATSSQINELTNKVSFIPEDYIKFLTTGNGADIAQVRFFDSDEYENKLEIYSDVYSKDCWYVFGAEAGGDPIMLNVEGFVAIGQGKSVSGGYRVVANSFSDFLNDVIMGCDYPLLFGVDKSEFQEFIKEEIEEDPWLAFLVEQKWLVVETSA